MIYLIGCALFYGGLICCFTAVIAALSLIVYVTWDLARKDLVSCAIVAFALLIALGMPIGGILMHAGQPAAPDSASSIAVENS